MTNDQYTEAYNTLSEITAKAIEELAKTNPELATRVSEVDDAITEHCCNTYFDDFAFTFLGE